MGLEFLLLLKRVEAATLHLHEKAPYFRILNNDFIIQNNLVFSIMFGLVQ